MFCRMYCTVDFIGVGGFVIILAVTPGDMVSGVYFGGELEISCGNRLLLKTQKMMSKI